jgi:hypothetical protein
MGGRGRAHVGGRPQEVSSFKLNGEGRPPCLKINKCGLRGWRRGGFFGGRRHLAETQQKAEPHGLDAELELGPLRNSLRPVALSASPRGPLQKGF